MQQKAFRDDTVAIPQIALGFSEGVLAQSIDAAPFRL